MRVCTLQLTMSIQYYTIHCKKGSDFTVPSRDVNCTNYPKLGKIKLFPARESLVSDIPAGDGKMVNLFLQCRRCKYDLSCFSLSISLLTNLKISVYMTVIIQGRSYQYKSLFSEFFLVWHFFFFWGGGGFVLGFFF